MMAELVYQSKKVSLLDGSYKSVWDFGRAGQANYSVHTIGEYPSKIRPIVIAEVVNRFSEMSDTVLDPFCGGGTVPIEAKLQGRNSISYDVSPKAVELAKKRLEALDRDEMIRATQEFLDADLANRAKATRKFQKIQFEKRTSFYRQKLEELQKESSPYLATTHKVSVGDARTLELSPESVDAVITDIPYGSMIRYTDQIDDLSTMDYDSFLEGIYEAFSVVWKALKKGKYCVVFVADYRVGAARKILPIHSHVTNLLEEIGFFLFDTGIWRYYRSGGFRPFGKPPYQMMNVHIYFLVFYKPNGSEDFSKSNRAPRYRPRLAEKLRTLRTE